MKETHRKSSWDQFERLVSTQTASSLARKIATKIPQCSTPPDSLDLALASTYDHHANWGAARAFVVRQAKSCTVDHASEFKRKLHGDNEKSCHDEDHREARGSYRNDSYHIQLGIPPYHSSNSRRGYGRSADGSFYST